MLFCIFRTKLVFDLDMCGKYIIKEYDDVSIYSMHTPAVGCTFESRVVWAYQHMGLPFSHKRFARPPESGELRQDSWRDFFS